MFPSVHFCNFNQVSKSFLRNVGVAENDHAANLFFEQFLTGSKSNASLNPEDQVLLNEFAMKLEKVYGWQNSTRLTSLSSQNCSDMIIWVSWKSQIGKQRVFKKYDLFQCCIKY